MYQSVSALRSSRFPLMGTGDGLGCPCSPTAGLGLDIGSAVVGGSTVGAGLLGLVAGYFLGKHAQRVGLAANRRRRARRSRR